MAFGKLFQQFTQGAGKAGEQAEEMPSAREIDKEVTASQPDAGAEAPKAAAPTAPLNPVEIGILEEEVIEAIRTCYDPEIPVNIYDLGLVYEIEIDKKAFVDVKMTLTSPGCPVAGTLPPEVEQKVRQVPGVSGAKVAVVWDPPWNMEMMSEEARLELGFY